MEMEIFRIRLENNISVRQCPKWQCPKYCVNEKTGFRYNLLYLDSVFKYKNKLVHNQTPIMNRLRPFLLNFHQIQIDVLALCTKLYIVPHF